MLAIAINIEQRHTPWQVGHRLELVVEKELGQHEQEAESVDPVDRGLDGPAVPGLVGRVHQAVDGATCNIAQITVKLF